MVVAKKYVYAEKFVGEPKLSDFKLVEEELPPLKENGKISHKKIWPIVYRFFSSSRGARSSVIFKR